MCHFCDNKVSVKTVVQVPLTDNNGVPNGKILTLSKQAYDKILEKAQEVKNEKLGR